MTTGEQKQRLIQIVTARSFRRGEFTLASGKKSNLYFNLKPTMMDPEGAHLIASAMLDLLPPGTDYVGGLEMGAVPLAAACAAISFEQDRPVRAFFVRKQAKEHGAKQQVEGLAEGETLAGRRVALLEDVTTTGGSVLKAALMVREAGGAVDTVVTVLDRLEGAGEALAAEGLSLKPVLTARDFI
jgi:orotate phosphoribosyltransferase